jgi:hypothetical protein
MATTANEAEVHRIRRVAGLLYIAARPVRILKSINWRIACACWHGSHY